MAVVGHWLVSFLLGSVVPEASITVLCKMAMLSDALAAILAIFQVERIGIYPRWLQSTPPPGTESLVLEWKRRGVWQQGVDLDPGENGFHGFGAVFPFYVDVSYSHSVELMLLLSVPLAGCLLVSRRIGARYAAAIILTAVSHPCLDILFHDAHIFMGDRAKSKYSVGLWQYDRLIVPLLAMELLMAYLPYRLWLSSRVPIGSGEEITTSIAKYKKMFWTMAISHNQASWYVVSPLMQWLFFSYLPQPAFAFGADNEWSYLVAGLTILSWTGALYPLYKLEMLLSHKDTRMTGTKHLLDADFEVPP
eukprot:TRINITY_DN17466_c0_g1_i1.p1 TRINITY_DN17466_c0_g1~~TRINITY_DN17466_c0_g1_i1.p1  ORF type:complete len:306 (+),score=30.87 TRINITY_DN17466_c0_g1_i1:88-1005(+)